MQGNANRARQNKGPLLIKAHKTVGGLDRQKATF